MLFFAIVQLFCFYKRGMVFSPWFNYGMYSEVIKPDSIYSVNKVFADGSLLQGNKYSPQEWDKIHFTLTQTAAAECNGNFYNKQISRLFEKFDFNAPDSLRYVNTGTNTSGAFIDYSNWLRQTFHFNYIDVLPLRYVWNGNELSLRDTSTAIVYSSFLCK